MSGNARSLLSAMARHSKAQPPTAELTQPWRREGGGGCVVLWGQTSREGVRGKRTYGGRPGQRVEVQGTWASPHRNTARQAIDGLWTEACGQQKQSNDPGNNQHIFNTPTIGCR